MSIFFSARLSTLDQDLIVSRFAKQSTTNEEFEEREKERDFRRLLYFCLIINYRLYSLDDGSILERRTIQLILIYPSI